MDVEFYLMFFLHLLRRSYVFLLRSVNVVNYINQLSTIKPTLCSQDKSDMLAFLMHCLIWFANILFRISTSYFMSASSQQFSFLVLSFSGFGYQGHVSLIKYYPMQWYI